ncbi:MAG: hypothetical protein HFH68_01625 [Lachnospiraceae bacterium]|nr:hypothetical protein [Lachnospiraceae bacterium]
MKIVAVLEVDEKKLAETGHSFEEEMGWAEQSGIILKEYQEIRKRSTDGLPDDVIENSFTL